MAVLVFRQCVDPDSNIGTAHHLSRGITGTANVRRNENTRRLERSSLNQSAGYAESRSPQSRSLQVLDHSKYDRADKGECNIGGNNAQLSDEIHGETPWFTSWTVVTHKASNAFPAEKVSTAEPLPFEFPQLAQPRG